MTKTNREKYKWNPTFNIVMSVKDYYQEKFDDDNSCFKEWLSRLNNEVYNGFFDCLQINQENEFILIRYGVAEMQRSMWTEQNSPYRECRSIVIDLKRESLVTCGFRKFFNLNEVEETMLDKVVQDIQKSTVFEVSDKLDGSMQNARWYEEDVFMTGSMALSPDMSWRLANGKALLTSGYIKMLKENQDLTFTFEYISDVNPHVVTYSKEQEGLYLIGARDVNNGRQLHYHELHDIVRDYSEVKICEMEEKTIEEVLELMKSMPANKKEGWILNIDGHLIKIKCDDYVNIHRILDKVSSVNVIIEAIAEGRYDDLISKIPTEYHNRVQEQSRKVFEYAEYMNKMIEESYRNAPKEDKKSFMIWVNQNVNKSVQPYVRCKFLGQAYNILKKGRDGYKKVKDLEMEELQ